MDYLKSGGLPKYGYKKTNKLFRPKAVKQYRPMNAAHYRKKINLYATGGYVDPQDRELFRGNPGEIIQDLGSGYGGPTRVIKAKEPNAMLGKAAKFLKNLFVTPEITIHPLSKGYDEQIAERAGVDPKFVPSLRDYKSNGYESFNAELRDHSGFPVTNKTHVMDASLRQFMKPLDEDMVLYRHVPRQDNIVTHEYHALPKMSGTMKGQKPVPQKKFENLEIGDTVSSLGFTSASKFPVGDDGYRFKIQMYKGDPVIDVNHLLYNNKAPEPPMLFNEHEVIIPNHQRYVVMERNGNDFTLGHFKEPDSHFSSPPSAFLSGLLPLGLATSKNTIYNQQPGNVESDEETTAKKRRKR